MSNSPLSPDAAARVYRILCHLSHCDGDVDPAERARLESLREQFGLDSEAAYGLEKESVRSSKLVLGDDPGEREFMLGAMKDLVGADGEIRDEERERLISLGKSLGLPTGDILG